MFCARPRKLPENAQSRCGKRRAGVCEVATGQEGSIATRISQQIQHLLDIERTALGARSRRGIPARVYCPIDKDDLGRSTHNPDLGVCRSGRNTRTPRANASSYKAHKRLSRRDRHPWACGGMARRSRRFVLYPDSDTCRMQLYLCSSLEPGRYEFHLTGFAENLANLEAIHALLTQYGHPDVHIVDHSLTSSLDEHVFDYGYCRGQHLGKSLLRAVAHEWAATHSNVDYFPSYEIVQNSDRAAVWESDLRHVKGAGAQRVIELFLRNYIE